MTQIKKIVLSSSRDIPFNKLRLSQANVRRIKAGVSIEELAEDIARRTLLQSLTVRPICDAEGELDRNVLLAAGQVRNLKRPRLLLRPARGAGDIAAELTRFNFRHLRA